MTSTTANPRYLNTPTAFSLTRKACGLKQWQIARLANLQPRAVGQFERGRKVSGETVHACIEALKSTTEYKSIYEEAAD